MIIAFHLNLNLLTFMIILLITLSKSNSKLTNDSVSIVLRLHSVIMPLSSNLKFRIKLARHKNTKINLKIYYKSVKGCPYPS